MNNLKIIMKALAVVSVVIFILMMLPINTSAADRINIDVDRISELENDEIILGEVSDINGNNKELIQQIDKIVIGNLSLPGQTIRIDKDLILIHLKQNDIDVSNVNITVPNDALATRKSIEISPEEIKKIVFDYIYDKLRLDEKRVNVSNIKIDNQVSLAKGDVSCKVVQPKNTELLGNTLLSLEFSVNGRFQKKVWVTADIEVFAHVVVTTRPLGRYHLITEDDIRVVEMNLAKLPTDVFMNCKDVLGKRARRAIDYNVVLKTDFVEYPPLVKKGDIVLIIAESDSLKVTTIGKVKENGSKGQMVQVENIDSANDIYARVLTSNSVKVDW